MNSLILEISGLSVDFDYEYLGEDILGFQLFGPLSNNTMRQILQNINLGNVTLLGTNDARISLKLISQMAGKFYKEIDFLSYSSSNTNGIYEILAGLVSSDVWINLNMDKEALLKVASDNLSLISDII
jgi:hypothetical protein